MPGSGRPVIRTQIPPPMDRRAASYVKEQLVYNQIKPEDAPPPPPSLGTAQGSRDPFQGDEKRGILRFLRRILFGKKQ
ncbi:unnamed protein product [Ectocarpus sp. 8 AP-2014]